MPWFYRLLHHQEPSTDDRMIVANMKERELHYLQMNIEEEISLYGIIKLHLIVVPIQLPFQFQCEKEARNCAEGERAFGRNFFNSTWRSNRGRRQITKEYRLHNKASIRFARTVRISSPVAKFCIAKEIACAVLSTQFFFVSSSLRFNPNLIQLYLQVAREQINQSAPPQTSM